MDNTQLQNGLLSKFTKSRIVFWQDADKSFVESIDELALDDITLLKLDELSLLETKKRIELDEPNQAFLLYSNQEVPCLEQDWLLDIRLYAETFYADVSSMILNELGITQMSLRHYIQLRTTFFSNKQRMSKLKRWVLESETPQTLDLKMIGVVFKADAYALNDLILAMIQRYVEKGMTEAADKSGFKKLAKFGLEPAFWEAVKTQFGYESELACLEGLLLKLFSTELWSLTPETDTTWIEGNALKGAACIANCLAFLKGWRNHVAYKDAYTECATHYEARLEIADHYKAESVFNVVDCETFEVIEQTLIRGLVGDLLSGGSLDNEAFGRVLNQRMLGFWVREKAAYGSIYKALKQAQKLMVLRNRYEDGFHYASANEMFKAYESELFEFDQAYRLFNEFTHEILSKGVDILRKLDDEIENIYTKWYLVQLSLAWDDLLDKENKMANWHLEDVERQTEFYENEVASLFKTTQLKRMFVVISDAFRYEIAHELVAELNDKKQFHAELDAQLGVLPSYTQLGMAALLPHKSLNYAESGSVVVDGRSTQGLENRNLVLSNVNGLAVNSKDLMAWSNQEGRERIKNCEVVYIYHNTIDDICDKQGGEDRTPLVCRDAIKELSDLMGRIINRLNGSRIVLTADHGFLFQQLSLDKASKTELKIKPDGAIESKKRYIVGRELPNYDQCFNGLVKDTAGAIDDSGFLLPRGIQRFHFVGGAKFVHGGASLQEVCVPIIRVRELEGKKIQAHQKKLVGAVLMSQPIKFVNNIDKIRLIQSDVVGDHFKARTLMLYIQDQLGNKVSTQEQLILDSAKPSMDDRIHDVRLKLVGSDFDRLHSYQLILLDVASNTVYEKYAVTIDLAIQDDFF